MSEPQFYRAARIGATLVDLLRHLARRNLLDVEAADAELIQRFL